MTQKPHKRLLSRLGLHAWYTDGTLLSSVRRCNFCPVVDDEVAARRMELERQFWEEEPDADFKTRFKHVAAKMMREIKHNPQLR